MLHLSFNNFNKPVNTYNGGRVWLTCVGRRCADGRGLLWNRSAWSLSVDIFRWSCAGGHGGGSVVTQCGVVVWEMRCSHQPLSNQTGVFSVGVDVDAIKHERSPRFKRWCLTSIARRYKSST